MDVFDLFAKIGLDTSEYESGLQKAGGLAAGFASKLGNGLKTAAKIGTAAITAVSSAAAAVGGYAVKVGSDFEAQMSKVGAISNATSSDMAALSNKAKELGSQTKFSATEAGQAFEYMAMAGWKTQDMLDGVSGIMSLAAASGEDLAAVSDIVTDAMTAFGLSASESGHFADVLAKASSSANTNVSMLGGTFKYAAPLAGALGYSIEDVAIAAGLMANSGIKAEQAGTSLRSMFTRLSNPPKDAATALDMLGVSIQNTDGTVKPLRQTLVDLREAFDGLSESEKTTRASQIAGQEAMSGLLAIVNAAPEDFEKLVAAVDDADGAAQKMADTMANNLQGQLTLLKSSAEGFGLALYENMQQPLTDLAKKGVEAINGLTTAFREGGIDGLVDAGGELIVNIVDGALQKLPDLIGLSANIIQSIGSALLERSDYLIQSAFDLILLFGRALADGAGGLADGAAALVESLATWIMEYDVVIPEMIVDLVQSIGNALINNAPKLITASLTIAASLGRGLVQMASELRDSALTLMASLGETIKNNLPDMLSAGLSMLSDLSGSLRSNAGILVDAALDLALNLAKGLADGIPAIIENVPTIVSNIAGVINDNAPKVFEAAVQIIWTLVKGLINAIPVIIQNMPKIIAAIWDTITAVNWMSLGSKVITGLKDGILAVAKLVKDAVVKVLNDPITFLKNLVNNFKTMGSNLMNFFGSGISGMAGSVTNAVHAAIDGAIAWIQSLPSRALEWGKDLIMNFVSGIKEKIFIFTDVFGGIVDKASNLWSGNSSASTRYINGSHAGGLDYVPFNGYIAELHKGERVLTAQEAKSFDRSGDVYFYISVNGKGDSDDARKYGQEIGREAVKIMRSKGTVL
ncbi:MAG: phage tail tape measure protein [Negativibacillus sp.]